jgi:hypothetical protein
LEAKGGHWNNSLRLLIYELTKGKYKNKSIYAKQRLLLQKILELANEFGLDITKLIKYGGKVSGVEQVLRFDQFMEFLAYYKVTIDPAKYPKLAAYLEKFINTFMKDGKLSLELIEKAFGPLTGKLRDRVLARIASASKWFKLLAASKGFRLLKIGGDALQIAIAPVILSQIPDKMNNKGPRGGLDDLLDLITMGIKPLLELILGKELFPDTEEPFFLDINENELPTLDEILTMTPEEWSVFWKIIWENDYELSQYLAIFSQYVAALRTLRKKGVELRSLTIEELKELINSDQTPVSGAAGADGTAGGGNGSGGGPGGGAEGGGTRQSEMVAGRLVRGPDGVWRFVPFKSGEPIRR